MGIDALKRRAVFLERDGVINHNWFNAATGEWESPIAARDFRLRAGVLDAMERLRDGGFLLFLVSNQPSAAKGKCGLADLASVHTAFVDMLAARKIIFEGFFYAYSHPQAIVAGMTEPAHERKPSPYFIEQAITRYGLDPAECWMIGDRDTDIECGRRAKVRTIQVTGSEPDGKAGQETPDYRSGDLAGAAAIVLKTALPSNANRRA